MAHTGHHRHQAPPELRAAVLEWADASADLASKLRQLDYDAPGERPPLRHLRLVEPQPARLRTPQHARPRRNWLAPLGRFLGRWQQASCLAYSLHPGVVMP